MAELVGLAFVGLVFLLLLAFQLEIEKVFRAFRSFFYGVDDERSERCLNRVQWEIHLDRFRGGYTSLCGSCLLARFDPVMHDVVRIKRLWFLRSRCAFYHSDAYVERVADRVETVQLRLSHGEALEAFGDTYAHAVVGRKIHWNGRTSSASLLWILTPYGMNEDEMIAAQAKIEWLANEISERLKSENMPWYVDGVRLCDSFEVRFGRRPRPKQFEPLGNFRWNFQRELIDDLRDSDRPRPETQGRFKVGMQELVQALKKGQNMKGFSNGEGEV